MTQLTPIKGFINTPVTKTICVFVTILAVMISIFQIKYLFQISIDPYILEYHQYWRLITYQISVSSESDYLLSILLWFHFKTLERFYGSNKYLSLIIILAIYNIILTFLTMSLGQLLINFIDYLILTLFHLKPFNYFTTFLNSITPGPLGVLSSLYICFGKVIPNSYQFKILLSNPFQQNSEPQSQSENQSPSPSNPQNLASSQAQTSSESLPSPVSYSTQMSHSNSKELILTDHFQIHIIYTLLLLNHGIKSIVPCLIGIFIGKLFCLDLLPGAKHWLLPTFVFRFFISPVTSTKRLMSSIGRRFSTYGYGFGIGSGFRSRGAYQSVNQIVDDDYDQEHDAADDQNDREEIIDDMRNNSDNEIRAETPVRPLASQFLDTFRRQE